MKSLFLYSGIFQFIGLINSVEIYDPMILKHLKERDHYFQFGIISGYSENDKFPQISNDQGEAAMNEVFKNHNMMKIEFMQDHTGNTPINSKEYEIFIIEFHRVETPFLIGIWIFFASLAKIGFHMTPRLNRIFPESCLLIVVGILVGLFLFQTSNVHISPLTPDTFFLYMLPPIILDAGYFMPNRLFFDHLGTILLFAVVGTIFNTLSIGVSLWIVGRSGFIGCDTPILDMLLFAALISAVDPVAVLAVFEEIHIDEILYIVVFGESLLNDAVTVVLYHMFEAYSEMGSQRIFYSDILSGFASFFVVAIGGTIIGVIWGFTTGFVTKFTNQVRVIEPIFIFVMAYLAYLTAEIFHMSGILAITFCGITMKNYVEANISYKSHTTIKYAMKMLSSSSETIIFMLLGVATVNNKHDWNTGFVLMTIVFCSIYRIAGIIVLAAVANQFRLHKLDKVEKFVMSYGGLRGAVAFALVLLIDVNHVPLQPMFVTTTITVIYFTVFFQGITIKPLVRFLNVKRAEKRKPTMNERIHERIMDHVMAGIEDVLGKHGNYHVRDKFKRFDNRYIRPYLVRNYCGAEPKILETYSKLTMKDALEYIRRNASTIGNISAVDSMSTIFRSPSNLGPLNRSSSCCQSGSSWNIDFQELEYNPSKRDLTDARIHHLLAEELCKPYKRHRRLSYSRHAVNDSDLNTQVNLKMHMDYRRLVGEHKHRSKRSKKITKDYRQNHVSFPESPAHPLQENEEKLYPFPDYPGQIQHDKNINEHSGPSVEDDWESAITFTARSSDVCKTTTPTAVEAVFPWKREEDSTTRPLTRNDLPTWCSNKDYFTHSSPYSTLSGYSEQYFHQDRSTYVAHGRAKTSHSLPEYGNPRMVHCDVTGTNCECVTTLSKAVTSSHSDSSIGFKCGRN